MIVITAIAVGVGVVLCALVLLIAAAWTVANGLAWLGRQQPDTAWKPTGFRYRYQGHDQTLGEKGRLESLARDAARRRAADLKPQRPARVIEMDRRSHR